MVLGLSLLKGLPLLILHNWLLLDLYDALLEIAQTTLNTQDFENVWKLMDSVIYEYFCLDRNCKVCQAAHQVRKMFWANKKLCTDFAWSHNCAADVTSYNT